MIEELKNNVLQGKNLSREEAIALSQIEEKEALYQAASEIRKKMAGNHFETCSVVNARSGLCSENCHWCSQSISYHTNAKTYEFIDENDLFAMAERNAKYGIHRFSFVTSGRAISDKNLERVCTDARTIKEKVGIELCASLGLVTKEQLQKMKDSGITTCHCNLETSRRFFPTLCSTHTYDDKIKTIKDAQSLGMAVCSGGIIGLGETMEDRIDLQMTIRDLGIHSTPFNILNPIKGTPLQENKRLSDEEILTTIALFRFINPTAYIMLAGGRTLIQNIEKKALSIGINALIMGDMLTTKGSKIQQDFQMIQELGFQAI